ncbi:hypothetical protein HPP92_001560 [Vanilla planifolia]|uniref:Uncharacterized protein n=1 Tax=Vanilla planifolia TaxID=51239 RepID=A0A835VLN5_VANPL|nr:hypothetical protein HPP92_001560 [Vanilla planifolia]
MEFKNRDFAPPCNDAGDADLADDNSGSLVLVDGVSVGVLPPIVTLSRKGSHRGGERKASEFSATVVPAASTDGENSDAVVIHVAREGESAALPPATTPTATATIGGNRCRRAPHRRSSRWLNPRRVLIFFATLSSMGTLVLLYFTLSMAKVTGGDANAR